MSELTTPKAVLIGFFLIAISIATLPITSSMLIRNASAEAYDLAAYLNEIQRAIEGIDKTLKGF